MVEPILNKSMEKAQSESYLSITSNDIKINLSKEFLEESQKNTYHRWIDEDVIDHIAKEELVEKFFCKFYPDSYDGEDEILDEGDNWGIDLLEFLSRVNSSFDKHMKIDGRTKKDYEWYDALDDCELKEEALRNKAIWMDNGNKELCEIHEQPVCNIRKYMMIKYSFNDDEEYVAIKEDEYDDLIMTRRDACQAYQERNLSD
ncbi:hypothetical protein Tco_0708565 [Tanacetum coccineum]